MSQLKALFRINVIRFLAVPLLTVVFLFGCGREQDVDPDAFPEIPEHILQEIREMNAPKPTVWTSFVFPTRQKNLLDTNSAGIYQPTAAGTIDSALYGSTRTVKRGRKFYSSFHEGIDVAPLERGRKGVPLDQVFSIADGTVAYANSISGNSSYGRYVVVLHDDAMGPVYSLYAHLADVAVEKGDCVKAGDVLGTMGNTATYRIPMQRAHLHFEIGVILNKHFSQWFKKKKLKPNHGNYNGWNLLGLNPYDFIAARSTNVYLSFADLIGSVPVVFECIVRDPERPSYFDMYPGLWQGDAWQGVAYVIGFSENGVPLYGRNATLEEITAMKNGKRDVLSVNEELIGRNGRRLVVKRKGKRVLGNAGKKHLEMLCY